MKNKKKAIYKNTNVVLSTIDRNEAVAGGTA